MKCRRGEKFHTPPVEGGLNEGLIVFQVVFEGVDDGAGDDALLPVLRVVQLADDLQQGSVVEDEPHQQLHRRFAELQEASALLLNVQGILHIWDRKLGVEARSG